MPFASGLSLKFRLDLLSINCRIIVRVRIGVPSHVMLICVVFKLQKVYLIATSKICMSDMLLSEQWRKTTWKNMSGIRN